MSSSEKAFFTRKMQAVPKRTQLELPKAVAPSLEKLVINAPKPLPFTAEELMAFAEERARERAPRTHRKFGEQVKLGDVVQIDVLAYHEGRLLPFSARQGMEVIVGEGDSLPWLDESLLACSVGDGLELPVTLPDDGEVESLRGAQVTYLVDVVSAHHVELPAVESASYLKLISKKPTLDEAMEELGEKFEDERIALAWEEARECVIDELVRRTDVHLSVALIDEEILRTWKRVEAPFLESKGFEPDELKEALEGWLNDAATRVDAERRLRLALGLKALVDEKKLEFDKVALGVMVDTAKSRFGLKKDAIKKALKEGDERTHAAIEAVGLHMRALQIAVDAAEIHFVQ